jgi:hypothetical protein
MFRRNSYQRILAALQAALMPALGLVSAGGTANSIAGHTERQQLIADRNTSCIETKV